jgi:hypothetical protein
LDNLKEIFTNLDYLSECASNIALMEYKGIIRSEQGAYFCAVPKLSHTCIGEAFPLF